MELGAFIREVHDFPKPGIVFKDITPLLRNPDALRHSIDCLAETIKDKRVDLVCGIESRGFLFAVLLSQKLGVPFVPIRKRGKLPGEKISQCYDLEYGQDCLEIHSDAIAEGQKVAIVDDVLATGGTLKAATQLVERSNGKIVSCLCVLELAFLGGRRLLSDYKVNSLLMYR